jgi:hypothetical protein
MSGWAGRDEDGTLSIRPRRTGAPMHDQPLTIRAATARDVRRVLVAERAGVPVAALELSTGAVTTERPDHAVDAVAALRRHRYRLLRQGGDVGQAASLLRRLSRGAAVAT